MNECNECKMHGYEHFLKLFSQVNLHWIATAFSQLRLWRGAHLRPNSCLALAVTAEFTARTYTWTLSNLMDRAPITWVFSDGIRAPATDLAVPSHETPRAAQCRAHCEVRIVFPPRGVVHMCPATSCAYFWVGLVPATVWCVFPNRVVSSRGVRIVDSLKAWSWALHAGKSGRCLH